MNNSELTTDSKFKKKRMLMGVTLSEVGGCQKVIFDILTNLPDTEFDITLVTSPGGELLDWIKEFNEKRNFNIKIILLKTLKREISFWDDLKVLITLLKICYKGNYDIAHFHSSKMGLLGRIAAKLARVPKIYYTVHGWCLHASGSGLKLKIFGLLEKLGSMLSSKVICVSEHDLNEGILNGWLKKGNSCVIHNGISPFTGDSFDLKKKLNISEGIPVIATVERLSEPKDPLFTIRTAEYLKRFGSDFRLLIIGDGILRKDCEDLIEKLHIQDQVLLLGTCSNVREMLQSVDIALLFSKWEGLPISIIEAMYAGKPVIASNVGGIPELVTHGLTGFLIDSFEEKEAANFIIRLLDDMELRNKFGSEGKKKVLEEFTLDQMVRQYRELYS